jgi:two-component system sensor histidine kinase UhpB
MSELARKAEATILYADDTEAQRYAVSRVLRRAGFEVIEASTGRQALEKMTSSPDLVVLDVNLPDMSGLEVCRRIKSTEATVRTPVLHVSAMFVNTEARVAGLEGGADAYLVQPVAPEELVATIRALLRVRRAEEQLWESQQQYRLFFESNPLACWVFDVSDLKILAVNAAAVEQYGHSREEFMNLTLRDIPVPEELPAVLELLPENALPVAPSRIWKHRTRSGKQIEVEMIIAPLRLNGRDAGLAIVRDMTLKLELQAAERKEEVRRLLLERVLQIQESERQRISRELHDEAGQLMTSLLVGLRSMSDVRRLADAKAQAKRLREIASHAINEIGRLARGLHSTILDDLGLETAIRRYTDEFSQTHGIAVDVNFVSFELSAFTNQEQLNLYRIVQEALTNVARHAHAKKVMVTFGSDESGLSVTIRDDGRGFAAEDSTRIYSSSASSSSPLSSPLSSRLGIEGMRQRARMIGGELSVVPGPDGVTVSLFVPRKSGFKSAEGKLSDVRITEATR